MLAVSTYHGVVLWDLARGTELASLRIGNTYYALFEPAGDLLTLSREDGVLRWPVRLDADRGGFRVGPPLLLPLPSGVGIAEDRSGHSMAVAHRRLALVSASGRTVQVGPLRDVRSVALSADGEWLATGSHRTRCPGLAHPRRHGRQGRRAADRFGTRGRLQPRWQMGVDAGITLPALGAGHRAQVRQIGGYGLCFSPDGGLLAVQDADKVLRLVEAGTNRTVARLESPDLCDVEWATFSPDGSRLVVITNEGPAVHIWDLRAIRRKLADIDLDWEAPAYPEVDAAGPSAPPLPPLQVELDPLDGHIEQRDQSPEELIALHTRRIGKDPEDAESYHRAAMPWFDCNGSPRRSRTSTGRSACGLSTCTSGSSGERSNGS